MKSRFKSFWCCALVIGIAWCSNAQPAQAGPLLDWLRGCRKRPQPTMPVASCGLQPGQCQTTCQQQCSRVVVNYVPYTAYRANWEQVPVTQYKPVTNTDPCTGCTVTCMKPCTSYTWQMKQVPYTTYRPVYRTESYSVPVTYVSQSPAGCSTCATGYQPAVDGCSTCGVNPGTINPGTTVPPYYNAPGIPGPTLAPGPTTSSYWNMPNGALSTSGNYTILPGGTTTTTPGYGSSVPTPADVTPSIEGTSAPGIQRSVIEQMRNTSTSTFGERRDDRSSQTAAAPVRQPWSYNPVRLASHQELSSNNHQVEKPQWVDGNDDQNVHFGTLRKVETNKTNLVPVKKVNSDWTSASW